MGTVPINRTAFRACAALLFAALAGAVAAQHKPAPAAADAKHEETLPVGTRAWKGDLDEMTTKRRVIRALVPYSKTFYYVERGRARGISYEILQQFDQDLNKKLKTKNLKVRVLFLPVGREELIQRLVDGYGDVIVADLTITPERQKIVDFSDPLYSGIKEIVVTGPGGPEIATLDDLAGKEVFVRKTSSYHEHLQALNKRFASEGKSAVKIQVADEDLEAEDILEMVNAGLIGATVVDRYKAIMWSRVLTNLKLSNDAVLADGGENAFVIRKDSPKLKAALNAFVKQYGQGTTFGNSIVNRYVKDPKFVKNAIGSDEVRRFGQVVAVFRKYGDKYDVDHLLMIAQGFQESGLDQNAKSTVGAIGIMQLMPATGKELKVGDITQIEANIHGGVKYMRFMIDQYYANEPMTPLNKGLFAFASYNAGAGRVAGLRREAAKRGLDPNKWFHNVELVAADKIGSETVTYVSNIYKYYTAYKLLEEQEASRQAARAQAGADKAGAPKAAK
jgi:membrane-bound lytic murein transglycosylase MltF